MPAAPEILYRNLLADAQDGRGDGTIYAWGTSAVVDKAAKTFDLTTVNIMTDLGANAADLFNGYKLVFDANPDGGYLITDWTTADLATTFEVPNITHTGSWTIRRTLYTSDFAPASPISLVADGRLYQKWIDKAANNLVEIYAAAPNGVDDGGFEKNSLTDYWTTSVDGDGTITVNPTSPILGTYDCKLDMGTTGTIASVYQAGKIDLKAGRIYGVILKARRVTAETSDKFRVYLNYASPSGITVPLSWTKINIADSITGSKFWYPVLDTTAAWEEAIFTITEDISAGDYNIFLRNEDTTNRYAVHIDEIYLWEIGPTPASGIPSPDTLIIGNHNMAGGFAAQSAVFAMKVHNDLTGWVGTVPERKLLLDMDANVTVDGNSPIYETWTEQTSIYPIHAVQFQAISGKTFEAGEIWVGQRWTWDRFVSGKWAPYDGDIEVSSISSFGGVDVIGERFRKRRMAGRIPLIDDEDFTTWKRFIEQVGVGASFWYRMQALTGPVTDEEIMLMRNTARPSIRADLAGNLSVDSFSFKEVF